MRGRYELLDRKIREFSCARDSDVEAFLKEKAISYEIRGYSRTYLYVTGIGNATGNHSNIVAYFSVAITATDFEGISRSRKVKVLGSKPGRDTKDHFGGILIAQLARSDSFGHSIISGKEMISDAENVIEKGREYLGGRIVYLDCKNELIEFYRENGYAMIGTQPYPSGYFKMFKRLPELPV
jgi:hypothetical protein